MPSQGDLPEAKDAEPDGGVGTPTALPAAGTAAGAGRVRPAPAPDDPAEAARLEARRELAVVKRMREEAERSRSALAAARREVEAERARLEDLRMQIERERAALPTAGAGPEAEADMEDSEPAVATRPSADLPRRPAKRGRRPAPARAPRRGDDLPLRVAAAALTVPLLVALAVVLDAF